MDDDMRHEFRMASGQMVMGLTEAFEDDEMWGLAAAAIEAIDHAARHLRGQGVSGVLACQLIQSWVVAAVFGENHKETA